MKKINFQYKKEIVGAINKFHSAGYTSAIVAGGVIRDSIMGKPVSDIDLYVWDPEHSRDPASGRTLDGRELWKLFAVVDSNGKYNKTDHYVKASYIDYNQIFENLITKIHNVQLKGITIQVIQLKMRPTKFIDRKFNIGLCKAYFDGERVRLTPDFINDMNTKTLTVCAPDLTKEELQYTMNFHLPKLQQKYPEFQHDLAPHVQTMFTQLIKEMLNQVPF